MNSVDDGRLRSLFRSPGFNIRRPHWDSTRVDPVSKTGMGGFVHRGFESLPLRCSGETAPSAGQSHVAGHPAADPTRVNRGQLGTALEGLVPSAVPQPAAYRRQASLCQALRPAAPPRERARLRCFSSSAALAAMRSSSVIACQRVPRRCPVRRARPAASSSRSIPST